MGNFEENMETCLQFIQLYLKIWLYVMHITLYYAHQSPNGQMQRKEITLVLLAHCCSALWYIVLLSLKVSLTSKAHIVLDHNRGGQVYREELELSVEKFVHQISSSRITNSQQNNLLLNISHIAQFRFFENKSVFSSKMLLLNIYGKEELALSVEKFVHQIYFSRISNCRKFIEQYGLLILPEA